jgi:hypothetical protein
MSYAWPTMLFISDISRFAGFVNATLITYRRNILTGGRLSEVKGLKGFHQHLYL